MSDFSGLLNPFKNEWHFAQSAVIRNKWLPKIEFVLKWGLIIGRMVDLFVREKHMAITIPGAEVSFWAYRNGAIVASKEQVLAGDLPDYCTDQMHNYNYGGGWTYFNYTCVVPAFSEMHQKMETSIFFLTSFQEEIVHVEPQSTFNQNTACKKGENNFAEYTCSNTTGVEICECSWTNSYFAMPVMGMGLDFQHSYRVDFGGANSANMKTFIYNEDNELKYEFDSVAPGMDIANWLELVGITDLDVENPENFESVPHEQVIPNEDGSYRSPIYRITGMKIKLRLKYSNLKTVTGLGNEDETVCQIFVSKSAEWNSRGSMVTYLDYPVLPTDDAEGIPYSSGFRLVDRYRYGITFLFSTDGEIGKTDAGIIIQELINMVVLIQLTSLVVKFIALNFWPQFDSAIYHDQIHNPAPEQTRRMYWSKYLYNIAFHGYAKNGRIDYANWGKFCNKYGLPNNSVELCWNEATQNDHYKQPVEKLSETLCRYKGKYISLVSICRAARRVPLSNLGRFMRTVETKVVTDVVKGIQNQDGDDSEDEDQQERERRISSIGRQQTIQANDIRRASQRVQQLNGDNENASKSLHMNSEDYKIFFKDIPMLHEYYHSLVNQWQPEKEDTVPDMNVVWVERQVMKLRLMALDKEAGKEVDAKEAAACLAKCEELIEKFRKVLSDKTRAEIAEQLNACKTTLKL